MLERIIVTMKIIFGVAPYLFEPEAHSREEQMPVETESSSRH